MTLLLSLESSTTVCSAALHEDGELLLAREVHTPQAAASQLTLLIDELFATTGIKRRDLVAVAVSAGPGSYTGLRIGTATAKGICYGLDRPMIALDSLHVLASSLPVQPDNRLLCPMIDARRMEVYCCLVTPSLNVVEPTQAKIIDDTSFVDRLSNQIIVFHGNGAAKCREIIRHPNALFIDDSYPNAAAMGTLAFRKFEAREFVDLRTFEPAYLKEFVAKTKKV